MKILRSLLSDFVEVRDDDDLEEILMWRGAPVESAQDLAGGDRLYEVEVTANRGDLLSHLGLAREVASATGRPLREVASEVEGGGFTTAERVRIRIEDEAACGRYLGWVLEGADPSRPSPKRLAETLERLGARSLSAAVDVTNFVLFELGQPLHVFDLDKLEGPEIVVRRAKKGETLLALDGVAYELDETDLVIADAARPVALAGIIGGEETAVGPETRRILLEAAWFDPKAIRRTARRLRISTESSYRFERTVDRCGVARAARYAVRLLADATGATPAREPVDLHPGKAPPRRLPLRPERIAADLDLALTKDEVERALASLGFAVEGGEVVVPSHRSDVSEEADLVEEVGRVVGYDKIPERLPPLAYVPSSIDTTSEDPTPVPGLPPREALRRRLRAMLAGRGYAECVTFSLEDPTALAKACWGGDHVALEKPLAENLSVLRPSLVPGLVRVAGRNAARGALGGRLFEIGRVFAPPAREEERLALFAWGEVLGANWASPARPADAHEVFADLAAVFSALGLSIEAEPAQKAPRGGAAALRAGDGQAIGRVEILSAASTRPLGLEPPAKGPLRAYAAEVSLEALLELLPSTPAEMPAPPRFPASERDLAFLFPKDVPAGELLRALRSAAGEICESVVLFDVYEGEGVPEGKVSYAFRLVFRRPDRTLRDAEIDEAFSSAMRTLQEKGGVLRGAGHSA